MKVVMSYRKRRSELSAFLPEAFEITMSLEDDPGPRPDSELSPEDINTLSELLKSAPKEMDEAILKRRDELYEVDPRFRQQRDQVALLSPQLAAALERRPDVAVAFWESFRKLPQWANDNAQSINWKYIYRVLSRCLIVDSALAGIVTTNDLTDHTPVVSVSDSSLHLIASEMHALQTTGFSCSSARVLSHPQLAYAHWLIGPTEAELSAERQQAISALVTQLKEDPQSAETFYRIADNPSTLATSSSSSTSLTDYELAYKRRHHRHGLQRRNFHLLQDAIDNARPGDFIYVSHESVHHAAYLRSPRLSSALVDTLASMNASQTLQQVIPVHADIPANYKGKTGLEILRTLIRPTIPASELSRIKETLWVGLTGTHVNLTKLAQTLPVLLVSKPDITIFGKTDGLEVQEQAPIITAPVVWVGTGGTLSSVDILQPVFVGPNTSLRILDGTVAAPFHLSEKASLTLVDCAIEEIQPSDEDLEQFSDPFTTFLKLPPFNTNFHLHFDHVEIMGRLELPQMIALYQKLVTLPVQDIKAAFEAEKRRKQQPLAIGDESASNTRDGVSFSGDASQPLSPSQSDSSSDMDPEYKRNMEFVKTITTLLNNDIFEDSLIDKKDKEMAHAIVPNGFGNAIRKTLVQWIDVMMEDPKFVSMTLGALRFIPDQLVFDETKQLGLVDLLLPVLKRHIDDPLVPATVFAVISKIARTASVPILVPLIRSPELWKLIHLIIGKIQGTVGDNTNLDASSASSSSGPISSATNMSELTSSMDQLKLSDSSLLNQSAELAPKNPLLYGRRLLPENQRSKLYMNETTVGALTAAISAYTFSQELCPFVFEELMDFLLWCAIEFENTPTIVDNLLATFGAVCRLLLPDPKYGSELTAKLIGRGILNLAFRVAKSGPLSAMLETADGLILTAVTVAPEATLAAAKAIRLKKMVWRSNNTLDLLKEPDCLPKCAEEDEDGLRLMLRAIAARGEKNVQQPTIIDRFIATAYLLDLDDEYWDLTRKFFEDELLTTRPKETQNISFISVIAHWMSLSTKKEHLVYLANSGFLQFIEGTNNRQLMDTELQMAALLNLTKVESIAREKAIRLKSCALHLQGAAAIEAEHIVDWANTVVDECKKYLENGEDDAADGAAAAVGGDANEGANEGDDNEGEEDPSFAELRAGARLILAPGTPEIPCESRLSISSNGLTIRHDGNDWASFMLELPNDEWLTSGKWCYEVVLNTDGPMQIGWAGPEFKHNHDYLYGVGDDQHSFAIDLERLALWHVPKDQVGVRDFIALDDALEQWQRGCAIICAVDIDAGEFIWAMSGEIRGKLKVDKMPEGGIRPAFTFGAAESISLNLGSKAMAEWKMINRGYTPICEPATPFTRAQSKERALALETRRFTGPGFAENINQFLEDQGIPGGDLNLGGANHLLPRVNFGGAGVPGAINLDPAALGLAMGGAGGRGGLGVIGGNGGAVGPRQPVLGAEPADNGVGGADNALNMPNINGVIDRLRQRFGLGVIGGGMNNPLEEDDIEEFEADFGGDIEVEDDRDNVFEGDMGFDEEDEELEEENSDYEE